jgi:hypothetical protein
MSADDDTGPTFTAEQEAVIARREEAARNAGAAATRKAHKAHAQRTSGEPVPDGETAPRMYTRSEVSAKVQAALADYRRAARFVAGPVVEPGLRDGLERAMEQTDAGPPTLVSAPTPTAPPAPPGSTPRRSWGLTKSDLAAAEDDLRGILAAVGRVR